MSSGWPPLGQSLNDFGGVWADYHDYLYAGYYADFYTSKPRWPIDGKSFAIKKQPLVDGECHTFWHIISEGGEEEERTPSMPRCECVRWPRALIDEFVRIYPAQESAQVKWWVETRGSRERFHIALADFSYMVVVEDRETYVLLWTAFPIERSHQRRRKEDTFNAYWELKAKAAQTRTAS